MKEDICFECGKTGFFIYGSPMRCSECIKNKVAIGNSPVRDSYWLISDENPCNFCGTPNAEFPNKKCARTSICTNE